jgi:hypothetical protein
VLLQRKCNLHLRFCKPATYFGELARRVQVQIARGSPLRAPDERSGLFPGDKPRTKKQEKKRTIKKYKMDLELLLDRATTRLSQLNRDQVLNVCKHLEFIEGDDETLADKSRRAIIKMAENKLDEIENDTETDVALQLMKELLSFMGEEAIQ